MKSKEEILKRNVESIAKCNVKYNVTQQGILNAMEEYAIKCQEDMADEMVKLKNAVQLSVDLLCEADEEIALLKEQLLGFQNP